MCSGEWEEGVVSSSPRRPLCPTGGTAPQTSQTSSCDASIRLPAPTAAMSQRKEPSSRVGCVLGAVGDPTGGLTTTDAHSLNTARAGVCKTHAVATRSVPRLRTVHIGRSPHALRTSARHGHGDVKEELKTWRKRGRACPSQHKRGLLVSWLTVVNAVGRRRGSPPSAEAPVRIQTRLMEL